MKFRALIVLAALSLNSAFATDITIARTTGDGDDDNTSFMHLNYTLVETGDPERPINWEASVGSVVATESSDLYYVDELDGHLISTDGRAEYITVGGQARKLINRETLEAIVRADYAFRTGGTTKWSGYSLHNGELYDPYGGLNVAAGANLIIHKNLGLGALVSKNINKGTTSVRVQLGFRFNGNKK